MVIDLGNIVCFFFSSKSFVEGKNENMGTVKENILLFKFMAISTKPLETGKAAVPYRELGDRQGREMRGKNIRLKISNSSV
jgi:hypothetical protein